MKHHFIYGCLAVLTLLVCAAEASAQRASQKAIPEVYIRNMQAKKAAGNTSASSANQTRASKKPITAFYSKEMMARQRTGAVQPSSDAPRASERPLTDFYTEEMRKKMSDKNR
ncbi:MAG TPA: hypothetical protein VGD17_03465 [Chitinophagaceae bacterium]